MRTGITPFAGVTDSTSQPMDELYDVFMERPLFRVSRLSSRRQARRRNWKRRLQGRKPAIHRAHATFGRFLRPVHADGLALPAQTTKIGRSSVPVGQPAAVKGPAMTTSLEFRQCAQKRRLGGEDPTTGRRGRRALCCVALGKMIADDQSSPLDQETASRESLVKRSAGNTLVPRTIAGGAKPCGRS